MTETKTPQKWMPVVAAVAALLLAVTIVMDAVAGRDFEPLTAVAAVAFAAAAVLQWRSIRRHRTPE